MPRQHKGQHGLDLSIVVPLFNELGTFDELHLHRLIPALASWGGARITEAWGGPRPVSVRSAGVLQ